MTGIDSVTEAGIDIGRRATIAQRRGQFPRARLIEADLDIDRLRSSARRDGE